VDRWRVSVSLLAELNATEAIDDLVAIINWTGHETGPIPHPPVRAALARFGARAVPPLLNALSDSNGSVRRESWETLVEIGEPAVDDF
jgi:HEAT repeat protein